MSASGRSHNTRQRNPPKKLEDYTVNESEGSSSPSSTNMSDTEENHENEQALLDRITTWERVMAKLKTKMNKEGASVCEWTSKKNDPLIKKYFKVRRKLLSPDELAGQYFWRDSTLYDEWRASSDVQALLSFLRLTTSDIDTKERRVFFCHGEPSGRSTNYDRQLEMSECIQVAVTDSAKFKDGRALLDNVGKASLRAIAEKMVPGVRDWLSFLGFTIKQNPATALECVFEELTRHFMLACGLMCANGALAQLTLQDKKCKPDLIFAKQHSTSPYWGVLEAKRMAVDPTFKHFFKDPTKGIMKRREEDPPKRKADSPSVLEDECIPSKKRCVTYPEEGNENKDYEDDDDDDDDDDYDDDDDGDSGSSVLPAHVREIVDIFFSQLFGEIISLDCCQPSRKNRRMGIGVVGFRIFFLAFYAKPGVSFAKIPETKGAKTEVHVVGPLCILDAKDREDIARILLLLAEGRPYIH